jgi:arylformamidase
LTLCVQFDECHNPKNLQDEPHLRPQPRISARVSRLVSMLVPAGAPGWLHADSASRRPRRLEGWAVLSARRLTIACLWTLTTISLPAATAPATVSSPTSAPTTPLAATEYEVLRDLIYASAETDQKLQMLDPYRRRGATEHVRTPVVIYVHGGGWAFGDKAKVHSKPAFFVGNGMSFISMNYRLRWDYEVHDQVEDIVKVVRWVRDNDSAYGLDATRIFLMVHAAGAHLVSLVATDARYLQADGQSLSAILGVIAVDTSGFDITRQMEELGNFVDRRRHSLIFGSDPDVWAAASPISHVEANKAISAFAVLYVAESQATKEKAGSFTRKLSRAGVEAIVIPRNAKTADSIDQEIGAPGDTPSIALMTFIRAKI